MRFAGEEHMCRRSSLLQREMMDALFPSKDMIDVEEEEFLDHCCAENDEFDDDFFETSSRPLRLGVDGVYHAGPEDRLSELDFGEDFFSKDEQEEAMRRRMAAGAG